MEEDIQKKKITALGLGLLLDFLGYEKEICGEIWCRARVSTSPRLMKKRKREREKLEENLGLA